MEIEVINRVITHWEKNGIILDGQKHWINDVLESSHITVPADFIELYQLSNGIADYDEEGFMFYKYEDFITMGEKFSLKEDNPLHKVVVFADYLHESWWYGFRANSNGYEIGIIPMMDKFKVISGSLTNFLRLYIRQEVVLYDV